MYIRGITGSATRSLSATAFSQNDTSTPAATRPRKRRWESLRRSLLTISRLTLDFAPQFAPW